MNEPAVTAKPGRAWPGQAAGLTAR